MKKKYFFSALAAGMVLFSACSQHDDVLNVADLSSSAQQIVLQVPSTGDGLQTRAGRQLYSAEAKQDIQNVKVIVTDAQDVVKYATTVENWGTASTAYTTGGHGRETNILIDPKLEAGTYTIYAVGYSNNSDYDLSAITGVTASAPGTDDPTKFTANTVLSFKQDATNKVGEEIFAGSKSLTVTDGEGFKESVVLNRQVAGTFGYFKEIPYIQGAAQLQLVACQLNTQLVLGSFSNTDLASNGNNAATYYVNGMTAATSNVVYTINLSDWYGTIADADNDGVIDATSWAKPSGYSDDVAFAEGSVFGGSFVIPFAKADNNETFILNLTDASGTVLRSWSVKLPSTDGQCSAHNLWSYNGGSWTAASVTDDVNHYSVVRNHLYGIGKKMFDKNPNPGDPDPDNPDPDVPEDDDPESLNNKQELTLRVNDNWEVIHQMELE